MRTWRAMYWFVTGACLGLGLVPWALGIFLLAIGVILLLVGAFALRGREAVTTVLGLGVGSGALFAYIAQLGTETGPAAQFVYEGLVISSVITLIGLVALVVVWRTQRREVGPPAS